MNLRTGFVVGSFAPMLFVSGAFAGSIGVQFSGGGNSAPVVSLTSSQVAGLVPQANYNVGSGATGTLGNLVDNLGSSTTASLTYNTGGTYGVSGSAPVSPDEILNQGLVNGTDPSSFALNVSGVPYAKYDVIVYELDDAPRIQRTTIGSTSYTVNSLGGSAAGYQDSNSGTAFTYIQGTDNSDTPVPNSDYVRFTGLSGSSFTILADATQNTFPGNGNANAFINGFQVVETPEPASLSLLGFGALGLLSRRRRA